MFQISIRQNCNRNIPHSMQSKENIALRTPKALFFRVLFLYSLYFLFCISYPTALQLIIFSEGIKMSDKLGFVGGVSLLKNNVLFEKRTKNFLKVLRGKKLRKLCCFTTHNDFLAILTGGSKIYNLLFN